MKITRTVSYALQATLQLAEADSPLPVSCRQLANEGEMPERFLLQVLRSLVTHGVLRSTRGVDGGYALVRPASEISLLDVIEAIDGPMDTHLPLEGKMNDTFKGNLQQAISGVTDCVKQQLSEIKISQLIATDD